MSRIEEALRRASVPSGPRNVYPLKDSLALAAEPATLADYPEEAPETVARQRRVEAVVPRKATPAAARTPSHLGPFPDALEGKLILSHATPVAVEQYRRLAATLHELQAAHGTKTLMVTSTVPREGKTLTVSNLAMTLSESYGRRVLLIDADLRRPSVHDVFGLPNNSGLSEGLRSDSSELSLLQLSPRLSVLTGGRPDSNPMAGLTSERMRALLEESAAVFDWVLLDAPPVGIMPDANLLARLTQGVIFVVAAGSTPHDLVDRAIGEIGREAIVGVVLNRIDPSSIPETGYYDQYYQSSE
jgi:protein-tyrosine kinase